MAALIVKPALDHVQPMVQRVGEIDPLICVMAESLDEAQKRLCETEQKTVLLASIHSDDESILPQLERLVSDSKAPSLAAIIALYAHAPRDSALLELGRVKDRALDQGTLFYPVQLPISDLEFRGLIAEIRLAIFGVLPGPLGACGEGSFRMHRRRLSTPVHAGNAGRLMRAARQSLCLGAEPMVEALHRVGWKLSVDHYCELEENVEYAASELSAPMWFSFCQWVGMSPDTLVQGYESFWHLKSVYDAIQSGSFQLPVTEALKQKLRQLEESEDEYFNEHFASEIWGIRRTHEG